MMNQKKMWLMFCIFGTVLPLSQFLPWLMEHGLDMNLFLQSLLANRISAFFAWDVMVTSACILALVFSPWQRAKVPHVWLVVVATFSVGPSLGLPLYFFLKSLGPKTA